MEIRTKSSHSENSTHPEIRILRMLHMLKNKTVTAENTYFFSVHNSLARPRAQGVLHTTAAHLSLFIAITCHLPELPAHLSIMFVWTLIRKAYTREREWWRPTQILRPPSVCSIWNANSPPFILQQKQSFKWWINCEIACAPLCVEWFIPCAWNKFFNSIIHTIHIHKVLVTFTPLSAQFLHPLVATGRCYLHVQFHEAALFIQNNCKCFLQFFF